MLHASLNRRSLLAVAVLALTAPIAQAATMSWSSGTSGAWATGTNWAGGVAPAAADLAVFGAFDQTSDITITLDGNRTIAGMTFGDANTLSSANWTIAPGTPSSSTLGVAGTIAVNLPAFPSFSTGQAVTIAAPLSGTAGFTKAGTGLLILSGSSTLSGTVVIGSNVANSGYQGAIRVTNSAALGTAVITQPAGGNNTLQALELAGGISFGNQVRIGGKDVGLPGIRNVSGANTYTGTVTQISTGGGTTLEAAGGTFTVAGLVTASGVSTRTLNLSGASTGVVSGVISGSFNQINKIGTGTWTLSGTSAISGAVQVNNGTLRLDGETGSFGTFGGGGITFSGGAGGGIGNYAGSGATIQYLGRSTGSTLATGTVTFAGGDNTISSVYGSSGTSGVTMAGLGTRAAGSTGNFVTTGGVNGTTNRLVLTTGSGNLLNPGIFFGGSNYAAYDAAGFVRGIAYGTDAGAVTTAGGASVAGTYVQLTGNVTAQTTATFATLNLAGSPSLTLGAAETLTVNGLLKSGGSGTSTISGGAGIQAAAGAELVVRSDLAGDSLRIGTPILANGVNAFTKSGAGTVTLAADNTFTGGVRVNAGTLAVAGSLTGTSTTTVMPGGKLVVTGTINPAAAAATGTLQVAPAPGNAVMEINGGTVNAGAAAVTIGSAAGANGSLVVNAGALNVNTTSQQDLRVGTGGQIGTPAYGSLTVNGGSVSVGGFLVAGFSTNGVGVVTIRGGDVTTNGAYGGTLGATAPSATANSLGVMEVSGGSFTSTNPAFSGLYVGENATGTLNVSGSGAVNLGGAAGNIGLRLGASNAAAVGVVNLGGVGTGGGTISTNVVQRGSGAGIFNFHGGTLEARAGIASGTNFMTGLTAAYVYGAGGTINTNGQDITIGQPLLAPTGNGVTAVSVTGGSGYVSPPVVTLAGGGGVGATAVARIDANGNLTGITVTNPGTGYTSAPVATLTGGGGSGAALGAVSIAANTSGGLTKTGAGRLVLTASNSYTGTTTIADGTLVATGGGAASPIVLTNGGFDGTGTYGSLSVADAAGNTVANGNGGIGQLTLSALSFGGAATMNLTVGTGTAAVAPVVVTGALTNTPASGAVTINPTAALWANGTQDLVRYGSFSGSLGGFTLGTVTGLSIRQTNPTLVLTGSSVALSISGDSLIWSGANGGIWTTGITGSTGPTPNWALATSNQPADFWASDIVQFNDTVNVSGTVAPPATTTVAISGGNVSPTSMTFNNSALDYTLTTGDGSGIAAGVLVKNGSGRLAVNVTNSFAGGSTINAGTVDANAASALGTGNVTLVGGTLNAVGSSSLGGGLVTLVGGRLNVNADAAIGSGTLAIAGGTLDNTSGAAVSMATSAPVGWTGDFRFAGTADGTHNLSLGSGAVTIGGTGSVRTVTLDGGVLTTGQLSAASVGLTKAGPGTLAINGAATSSIAGTLTVSDGRLSIGAFDLLAGGLAGSGTVANDSATTRWLVVTNTAATTFAGVLENGGGGGLLGFSKGGAGTLTLAGVNTYSDVTTVAGGVLQLSGDGSVAASSRYVLAPSGDGVLKVDRSDRIGPAPIDIQSSGAGSPAPGVQQRLEVSGNTTVAGPITYAPRNNDTVGIQSTSGSNTISGGITIVTGGSSTRIQSDAGLLTLSGPVTTTATSNRAFVLQGAGDGVLSGVISNNAGNAAGTVSITKYGTGTWTLTADNTSAGTTTVAGGVLRVGDGGATGSLPTGNVLNDATLVFNRSTPSVYAGAISGTGAVQKAGTGALTLSGSSTYSGPTTVSGGALLVTGAIPNSAVTVTSGTFDASGAVTAVTVANSSSAVVANGVGGTTPLTMGALTFSGAGTASVSIADAPGFAVAGQLATTGSAGLVTLNASRSLWTVGSTYPLISFGTFAGSLSDFTLGTVAGLTPRQSASLVTTGSAIALSIGGSGDYPLWTGAVSNVWTSGSSSPVNWALKDAHVATQFFSGDGAGFRDSVLVGVTPVVPTNTSISIQGGNVRPSFVTFDNSTLNYSISSPDGSGIETGSITKNGTGGVTITTSNSYAGGTTVNAGTLNANAASALGTGAVTVAGGTANLNAASSGTSFALALNGGVVNVNEASALVGAAVTIAGGTLGNTSGAAVTLANAPLQSWNGDFTFAGAADGSRDLSMGTSGTAGLGRVTLGGAGSTRTVTVTAGRLTVGGISGTAGGYGFTKAGNGTLTLNPSSLAGPVGSAVAGDLTVAGGTLEIGQFDFTAGGLAGSGTIANGSATTRWLVVTNTAANTFAGSLQDGSGGGLLGFSKGGDGTLTLTGSSSYGDVTTVTGGTLTFAGNGSIASSRSYAIAPGNGALRVDRSDRLGAATIDIQSSGANPSTASNRLEVVGSTTIANPITLAPRNNATPAIVNLSGTNTVTAQVTIVTGGSSARIESAAGQLTLAGSIVTTAVSNRNLVLAGAGDGVVTGSIYDNGTGTISVVKDGGGTWRLAAQNFNTGATTVAAGRLFVNGDSSTSPITVSAGATLGGSGTAGSVTLTAGATLAPGDGVGTFTIGQPTSFVAGGRYAWQLSDATGTAGATPGWDLLNLGGTLDIAATSASPFSIDLWTVSSANPLTSGSAANFNSNSDYTWTIATAAGGITNFSADKFAVVTTATNGTGGFANAFGTGTFSVAQSGNDLRLVFTHGTAPSVIVINVASGTQTQTQAGYPLLSGTVPVLKTGTGTLVVNQANTLTGSTTIQGGRLQLGTGDALQTSRIVPLAGGTLTLSSALQTTVGGLAPNAGGLTDVGNGLVTVASGLSTPDMLTALLAGRGDGSWNGTSGITSSVAQADLQASIPRTVGWLDNGDGSVTFAYAAPGDTNLDWTVDILDAANFLAGGKFDSGLPASWIEGDFGYDGVVDILDAAEFLSTGLFDAGPYNGSSGAAAVTAVPEPTGLAAVAVAALVAGVATRRRRATA
jgi:fibronectin-binding autotransporter adhesin